MVARGYIRVSTDEQARNGESIPAQTKILEAQALIKGYDDFKVYIDDGYSGRSLQRPAVQQLLRECSEGSVDVVLVWKLDRLSRSLRDILAIIEDLFNPNGVALISATESIDSSTPAGRAMLSVLGTFAQFEREQDSERVSMVHKSLAKDCRFLGGPVPLGYKIVDKHYAIDEATAPIVRKVFDMYIHREGYAEILRYLDSQGVTTAFGSPYTKSTLNHLLSNERYNGTYIHNRLASADAKGRRSSTRVKPEEDQIRIPGGIPAIIDMETWQAACALREEYRQYSGRQSGRVRFLLSGLCRCGVCGAPMVVDTAGADRNGTRQRYYTCKQRCVPAARKEKVEAAAIDALLHLSASPDLVEQACDAANALAATHAQAVTAERQALQSEYEDLTARIGNLTSALAASHADAPQSVLASIATLERQQGTVSRRLADIDRQRPYDSQKFLHAINGINSITKIPPAEAQTLLQTAFSQVAISQDAYTFILTGTCAVEMRDVRIKACVLRRTKAQNRSGISLSVTCDTNETLIYRYI